MSGAHALELLGVAGRPGSTVHRLDPRAKIVGLTLVTVVAVSTPLAAWPVLAACGAVLAAVAHAGRVPALVLWRRVRIVLPLVVFVAAFVPFARRGGAEVTLGPLAVSEAGLASFAAVAAKATIGTLSAALLAATTSFPALLRGLERLRVPRLFTLIGAFTYRYLFVVVDEVSRMRAGLAARGHRPRHLFAAGPTGRLVAALFLRTYGRGERVHLAMSARGWSGTMPELSPLRLAWTDAAFVALVAGPVLVLRVLA